MVGGNVRIIFSAIKSHRFDYIFRYSKTGDAVVYVDSFVAE